MIGRVADQKMTSRFRRRFQNFIFQENLLKKGDGVLVGISGGPDSTCLLILLSQIKEKYQLKLEAVHVNYSLRGKDSEEDEVFVFQLCQRLEIPLEVIDFKKELKETEKRKRYGEEFLRDFRYQWFEKLRQEKKLDWIAVGHNKDDLVETVLMNIIRGAGIAGLEGIKPQRGKIIRPLLFLERKEIEFFLKQMGQDFRIDRSNFDESFFRNKIRHRLIPLLEKEFNPKVKESLFSLAQNVVFWEELVKREFAKLEKRVIKKIKKEGKGKEKEEVIQINLPTFLQLPKEAREFFLREFLQKKGFFPKEAGRGFLREIEKIIRSQKSKTKTIKAEGLTISLKADKLVLKKGAKNF